MRTRGEREREKKTSLTHIKANKTNKQTCTTNKNGHVTLVTHLVLLVDQSKEIWCNGGPQTTATTTTTTTTVFIILLVSIFSMTTNVELTVTVHTHTHTRGKDVVTYQTDISTTKQKTDKGPRNTQRVPYSFTSDANQSLLFIIYCFTDEVHMMNDEFLTRKYCFFS